MRRTILLVGECGELRLDIVRSATALGVDLDVGSAATLGDALESLAAGPLPDVVVCDVRLADGGDGFAVKAACDAMDPPVLCYLVSGTPAFTPEQASFIVPRDRLGEWIEILLAGWAPPPLFPRGG